MNRVMKKSRPEKKSNASGHQRLSLEALQAWEKLKFGMFIHFGMSTFDGDEFSRGDKPSSFYAPDKLDVAQWAGVARDMGMRYAVLTAKHVSGHCLWPSRHTDYHVGTSGNRKDVVEAFVVQCRKAGIKPALYYCSWDNHHRFGSFTPTFPSDVGVKWGENMFATREYEDFQYRQLEELATRYGEIVEFWIDIPMILSQAFRHQLYYRLAELQPEALILMNHGFEANGKVSHAAWPTDVFTYETYLPPYHVHPGGHCGAPALVQLEREKVLPARGIRRHDDSSLVLGQGGPAETGRGIAGGCPVKQGPRVQPRFECSSRCPWGDPGCPGERAETVAKTS